MSKKILIVDDSMIFRCAMSRLLEFAGYEVQGAEDGIDGLEQFEAFRPDLVAVDLNMPCMDGFEMIRRLRERSAVPVLILSARNTQADRAQGLSVGSNGYLIKPFRTDELFESIENLLSPQPDFRLEVPIIQ
jgi:DNA-binding response OmpR family regulator